MKTAAVAAHGLSLHRRPTESSVAHTPSRFEAPRPYDGHGNHLPVHLTPRQLEVLSLLGEGLPNKLICRRLNISTGTVKIHISCILRELGVTSRLQAVVSAQRCGLLGEPAFGSAGSAKDPAPQHLSAMAA